MDTETTEVIVYDSVEDSETIGFNDTTEVVENENYTEINNNIQKLNDSINTLIEVYTLSTEDNTEVIEEVTENPVVVALENLDSNVSELRKELNEYNEQEILREQAATEEVTEELSEESTEEVTTEEPQLVYLGSGTDTHLYLTSQVENADINDVYTMILSTRNILLLFLLVFVAFKFGSMLRDVFARFMNR